MMMLSKKRVGIASFDYWTRRLYLPNAIYVLYKTMHNINYNNNSKLLNHLRLFIRIKDNEKQYCLPITGNKRYFFMKKKYMTSDACGSFIVIFIPEASSPRPPMFI